jgi:hypothetical protein
MLDDTLVDAEDVEALGVVPVLGVIPRVQPRSLQELQHGAV